MNLREFIARVECEGMPVASEFLVMAMGENGKLLSLKDIHIDNEGRTVWLMVEDY